MNILLFGKTGQLGCALQPVLAPLGQLTMPDRPVNASGSTVPRGTAQTLAVDPHGLWQADFLAPEQLYEQTLALAPDVIINAAAYTAVDDAEKNAAAAMMINAEAPAVLARAAARCGALLIHYSTDYVFDGTGSQGWAESDTANPLNLYGRSKLMADQAIMESGCRHWIFRTSWVYSQQGHGFLQQMMRLALMRDRLQVVNDQFGAPTSAGLIAAVTAAALAKEGVPGKRLQEGLYHLAASGTTSWFDYACHIFERMRANGLTLALEHVLPISSEAFGRPAPRPLNSRLNTDKLTAALGVSLPDWRQGVDATVDALCAEVASGRFLLR